MDFQISEDCVKITPKYKSLRASELIEARRDDSQSKQPQVLPTQKRVYAENSQDEAEQVDRLHDMLYGQICPRRIERKEARIHAQWDDQKAAVSVLQVDGKFEHFGYIDNGKVYLENYEAMFLLEMGRLQIEYNSMIVSVEQAYTLLLGEETSSKYDEYLVYSNFSRMGYIVSKYNNCPLQLDPVEVTYADCVFGWLRSTIEKKPPPNAVKNSKFFDNVIKEAEHIKMLIKEPAVFDDSAADDELKASSASGDGEDVIDFRGRATVKSIKKFAGHHQPLKQKATEKASVNGSMIDFLKSEPEYKKFKQQFEKFNLIKMTSYNCNAASDGRRVKIRFDLYYRSSGASGGGNRSSQKIPAFRVIMLGKDESFPNHSEITSCYSGQRYRVPLVVVTISECKQMQAFLYQFST